MSNKTQEGGCQCGAIRFRTTAKPVRAMACHCNTCKQRTGSAYGIGVYFKQQDIEFFQGERRKFEFHSTESGRWLRNEFCPNCGATVAWTLALRPGIRGIAGGCYDDPDWFDIDAHIWANSARSDMQYPEDMPVHHKALPV